ncbi:ABC transporter permease [Clostridium sp. AM58-1XD]|uniref:ABC transporter permease n=1 Tax=Clostridium sp. AM58-1XD TaxID=2292307 RepID=UPI000E4E2384|nr:ABC transporter permease [Clostridium sp. AM58-1XD]RGZ00112.1 ABC transporter permease [Clostridium sp. AM58-1XD]
MKKYILKRMIIMIPVFIITSVIIFSIIHLTPGDPARVILGDRAVEEEVTALQEKMGLNKPLPIQYLEWVTGIFKGNLGESVYIDQPMTVIIVNHMKPTISLTIYALLIAAGIGIPFGILAARYRGGILDHAVTMVSLCGISVPNFVVALLLILLFAFHVHLFPIAGYKALKEGLGIHIRYLTLPALALGFIHMGLIMRMTRSSVLEVLNSDYIKMARAKGVGEAAIMVRHALKNALLPIITVIGQTAVTLLAGAVVSEAIFNIPGIGQLVVTSIERRDYMVIQAVVLVIALINMFLMLGLDILYAAVDPRIRLDSR